MVSLRTASVFASLIILSGGTSAIFPKEGIAAIALQKASLLPNADSVETLEVLSPAKRPPLQVRPASSVPRLRVTRRVQRDLAQRLNVQPSAVVVVDARPETWPDQCLGLARPFERCAGGEVSGWRIEVASGQQQWVYRTNRNGRQLGIDPLGGSPDFGRGDFSIQTSQQLLATVAEQVGQPVAKLQVLEVQGAVWNGCLGIFEPDQVCNMQALAGFRAIVSDGETNWVYHLSESGTQIVQNVTASGSKKPVQVNFDPVEMPTAEETVEPIENPTDPQIVFQSQLSGDLAGSLTKTVLLANGTLYREQSQLGGAVTQITLATLSAQEVLNFQETLEQIDFPNLNGLRYLTEAAFADYPTIQLQAPNLGNGIGVTYIDLEVANMPSDLQRIIDEWNDIIQ